jgi:tetratricopeptide (TPR) repeat protein
MNTLQILMLAATAFFAYKVYEHVSSLEDREEESSNDVRDISSMIKDADISYEKGDMNRALMALNTAHSYDDKNPEILNKLAFVQAKMNNDDIAIENYKKSLELNNDDVIHNSLASIYRKKGEYDLAKEHYEKALSIDNEYAITYYNYANLLLDMDDKNKAKEYYQKAYELDDELVQAKEELEKLEKE